MGITPAIFLFVAMMNEKFSGSNLLKVWIMMSLFVVPSSAQDTVYDYDIVIRGGRVLDGAGNPWVRADVAIKDGRFSDIGFIKGRGKKEIDATGNYVSPGWIDMMDQSGEVLLLNGRAENKVFMGVTSLIAGEGGTPVSSSEIGEYFSRLQRQGISVNFGTYYGAHQARMEVMRDLAGKPTAKQLQEMKAHVIEAMEAGALGVTTALIYPPSSFQSTEEIIELAKVAAQYGGIYASHIRDEGAGLLAAVYEAIEIGEKSNIAVEIFHFKAGYQPGWGRLLKEAGSLIDAARSRGVDIAADVYPYTAGGTGLEITVPNWVFNDGFEKGIEKLKSPAIREKLKRQLKAGSMPGWSNLVKASGGWRNIVLVNAANSGYEKYQFRSIADIASDLKQDPADIAWDIVVAAYPQRALAMFHMLSEKDVETALQFPWVSIGSDAAAAEKAGEIDALGLPHPRSYGTFPRIIAEYVKRRNTLSLEEAVRKMTSWPASRMGLVDRGIIRRGLKADLVVFNYGDIEDNASWEKPTQFPSGIEYVIVNGTVVVVDGIHMGEKPGEILKGRCAE